MELIDTHCHLPKSFTKSKEWVENAKEVEVIKLINVGTSLSSSKRVIKQAKEFDNVFASVAVYPNHEQERSFQEIEKELRVFLDEKDQNKIVGIGECGFDVSKLEDQRPVESQKELFELHIKLAGEYKLPIILHNRNGDAHIIETLQRNKGLNVKGVAHCFSQSLDFAHQLIDLNFYISFTALITYPQNDYLREVVKELPLKNIIIETDSPFLVPEELKGQGPNEPKNVLAVAQKIAEVKNVSIKEVAEQTTLNAYDLFDI